VEFTQSKSGSRKEDYMKRGSRLFIRTCYILPLVLLLFGCAATMQMQMPVQDVSQIAQNEGIVIGSVLMKGGKDILGRKGWRLDVYGIDPNLNNFSLDVEHGGEETVFVTKMLAGQYRFARLTQLGFSNAYADIDVPFTAHPAQTTYVGRMVIEFPSGLIGAGSEFLVEVEDVKEQTIASAEKTYGNLVRDAVTYLMGEEQYFAAIEIPQTFETVWYRPRKKDFLKAYSHSGTLTIGKDAFEFTCEGKQLTVPYTSIVAVRWGTLKGDSFNEWAIVMFSGETTTEIAAFKDGKMLGHGPDSKTIYRAFMKACAGYRGAEEK
jgi:hypothetical protein